MTVFKVNILLFPRFSAKLLRCVFTFCLLKSTFRHLGVNKILLQRLLTAKTTNICLYWSWEDDIVFILISVLIFFFYVILEAQIRFDWILIKIATTTSVAHSGEQVLRFTMFWYCNNWNHRGSGLQDLSGEFKYDWAHLRRVRSNGCVLVWQRKRYFADHEKKTTTKLRCLSGG